MAEQKIDAVGKTAFLIADWRQEESERAAPLFVDHLANLFSSPETRRLAASIAAASPGTKVLIQYRTRCFDALFLEELERGVRQVVVLGAGLDTRSVRLAADDVTVWEVDRREVLEFKKAKLEAAGYWVPAVPVACDYTAAEFLTALEARGFDRGRETFFLWEGNTMYLSEAQIDGLLARLARDVGAFRITFDYVSRRLVERATGQRKAQALVDGFGELGAPWVTGFDAVAGVAEKAGLEIVEDALIVDLIAAHHPVLELDRALFGDYAMATLEKPPGERGDPS